MIPVFIFLGHLEEDLSSMTEKAKKKSAKQKVKPLYAACDLLRDDLKFAGVRIQVHVLV